MRLIDADHILTMEEMQKMFTGETCCMKSSIQRVLSLFPTVEAVPVIHAKWIKGHRLCETYSGVLYPKKNKYFQYCSKCAAQFDIRDNETERFDYCPECGARMDGK